MKLSLIQLGLLIWKCWKSEIRRPPRLAAEIIVPVLLFAMLAGFRLGFELDDHNPECHFEAKPLPSAGYLPFLQGVICNYANECNENKTSVETGGYPYESRQLTENLSRQIQQLANTSNTVISSFPFPNITYSLLMENYQNFTEQNPELNSMFEEVSRSARNLSDSPISAAWQLVCNKPFPLQSLGLTDLFESQLGNNNASNDKEDSEPYSDQCSASLSLVKSIKPLWDVVGPLFFGKIVFYPNTPSTRKIMRNAEKMLDWAGALNDVLNSTLNFVNQAVDQIPRNWMDDVEDLMNSAGIPRNITAVIMEMLRNSNDLNQIKNYTKQARAYSTVLDCFRYRENGKVASRLEGHSSVDSMIESAMRFDADDNLLAAVEFKNVDTFMGDQVPNFVRYSIRMNPKNLDKSRWLKSRPRDRNNRRDPFAGHMRYFQSGFIYLQDAIEKSIISTRSPNSIYSDVGTVMQQFPFPCYMFDVFLANLANNLLLFIVLGWIFPASMIVKSVVLEKELKLREVARIMGISPGLHFASWFIFWLSVLAISVVLFEVIVFTCNIFSYSNPFLIVLVMLTYAAAVISFQFFISAFFSKANIGSVVGGLVYFLSYNAYGSIATGNPEGLTYMTIALSSLLPNCALGFSLSIIGQLEMATEGAQISNFMTPLSDDAQDEFTLFHGWLMLLIDAVLYYFIAWYIEYVYPGEYGVPKPFYFVLDPSFWFGNICSRRHTDDDKFHSIPEKTPFNFEADPSHLSVGISLKNITKIYNLGIIGRIGMKCGYNSKSSKKAVDSVSLSMYEGQITALLGHNGAGKTTALSMMTGMIPATSGSVSISGFDVASDLEQVRKVLGFCPQFNVLYDNLSVEDHLWFYARIRGLPKAEITTDIEKMLLDIDLTEKRLEQAQVLSGGMRRRLSIAVAFIGNSKCVILDEPTAGVDPYARRGIWDLLSKFRLGRTIVLSTHHMDEAEVLADRIAVLSQGKLQTVGSPLFLKESFGDGYKLTVIRTTPPETPALSSEWQDKITEFITKQGILNFSVVDNINGELHVKLGYDMVPKFGHFFSALQASYTQLNIANMGVSDASMEEVFIRLADKADSLEDAAENDVNNHQKKPVDTALPDYTPYSGFTLLINQFWALLVKRFHRVRRNWKGFITELLLPVIFVLLGIIIIKLSTLKTEDPPTIELHPYLMAPKASSTFDKRLYTFFSRQGESNEVSEGLDMAFSTSKFCGTRCIEPSVYKISGYACDLLLDDTTWYNSSSQFRQRYCTCSKDQVQQCESVEWRDPRNSHLLNFGNVPYRALKTGDKMLNLSGFNVADYIIDQYSSVRLNLYGGFSYLARSNGFLGQVSSVVVWFNNKGLISNVAYNNYVNNALYRLAASDSSFQNRPESFGIVAYNQPLNYTEEQFTTELIRKSIIDVMLAIMLILALSFIPASFVMFLIEDRVFDSKHVQFVSGLRPAIYWLGNYCWDCINFLIPALFCVIIFLIFDLEAYVNEKSVAALLLLFVLYGFAIAPMLYPVSFFVSTPSAAFVLLASANLFIGAGTTVATWFLDFLGQSDESLADVNKILKKVFLALPQYCLGRGLVEIAMDYRIAQGMAYFTGKDNFMNDVNPMEWDTCGIFYFALMIHIIFWLLFILFIEYGKAIFSCCCQFPCRKPGIVGYTPEPEDDDPDVAEERRTVEADSGDVHSPYTMIIKNLKKVFKIKGGRGSCSGRKKLTAVNKLTFGVQHGQCFGLLGVNGAGKSTTFNMLTGKLEPTSGAASIRGFNIAKDRNNVNKLIGYCPQYDCITPLLTGRENLEFFARLRGVPMKHISTVAEVNVARMDLTQHVDKKSGAYSGGNKRKLSAAIALIGEPPLVFLDEPTAGIDPRARRFLWRAISNLLLNGQSVVLTTHSMDECEALCTRLAIMVNGQFRCIGSPQHLMARFGEGYLVNLRFKAADDRSRLAQHMTSEFEAARALLKTKFDDVVLKEAHDNVAVYSIGASSQLPVDLGVLFSLLNDNLTISNLRISEFSVMQSSLDTVFITFAKMQASDISDAERLAVKEKVSKPIPV